MSLIEKDRICFYTSMFKGRSSAWEIAEFAVKKRAGGLELMNFCEELKTPNLSEALKIGKYARENNLSLPCFSVGVDFYADEQRREQIAYVKAYADICAALEIPYLHHTTITHLDPQKLQKPLDELITTSAEAALEINEYAASLGVRTIVEDQGFVVNGVESYQRFLKATDNRVGTLLDVGNIMMLDECAEDFFRVFANRTKHVHIKDYQLTDSPTSGVCYKTRAGKYLTDCEMGLGDISLRDTVAAIEASGYTGYYSLEFSNVKNESEVDRVLERMEKGFADK